MIKKGVDLIYYQSKNQDLKDKLIITCEPIELVRFLSYSDNDQEDVRNWFIDHMDNENFKKFYDQQEKFYENWIPRD